MLSVQLEQNTLTASVFNMRQLGSATHNANVHPQFKVPVPEFDTIVMISVFPLLLYQAPKAQPGELLHDHRHDHGRGQL